MKPVIHHKILLALFATFIFAALLVVNVTVSTEVPAAVQSEQVVETNPCANGFTLSVGVESANAQDSDLGTCHDGECEAVCGTPGTVICTGMDCGQGTELCHRE